MISLEDYVFRYRLEPSSVEGRAYQDLPTKLLETQLRNILDITIPCVGNREVKVDGFKLLRNRNSIYKLFDDSVGVAPISSGRSKEPPKANGLAYQDIRNASLFEPRIELIKRQLESLLTLVDLEVSGEVVHIDGFRLKSLKDWVVPSDCNPIEVFEHAATGCNCSCTFCYNRGNPPALALNNSPRPPDEELKELKTRIKYFSPQARRSLFLTQGSSCEVMAHPHILEVLRGLREKTEKPFRISTNGANLTSEIIRELAKLKPIYLDLSLNSSSPSRRGLLMQDTKPDIAIGALPLLKARRIPYSVVIVPWPLAISSGYFTSARYPAPLGFSSRDPRRGRGKRSEGPLGSVREMLDDMEGTVSYAAKHDAHLVQISLPGYSKHFSEDKLFDLDYIWRTVINRVRKLRMEYGCPLVVMPSMYEENVWEERKGLAKIIGVVKNSPAALAGLRMGDIILRLNGISVRNRVQARGLLTILQQSEVKEASILVLRDDQSIELNLDLRKYSYPYSPQTDTHLGVIFMGTGLRMSYLERLKDIIQAHRAKDVLLLSSELVKPSLEQSLVESHLFGDNQLKIEIEVPKNRFFGGNIFMGDLLVVQDFIDYIEEHIARKESKPDLVVIPSSPFNLSQWGRDLTGRVYLDIEREVGIPVELLECATIYD